MAMDENTASWPGASGKQYKYWIYPIGTAFRSEPGNYIFAKETSPGRWHAVYIGESEDLGDRLTSSHEKLPCVRRNGGTHVHSHTTAGGQTVRRAEEADLIANCAPPCNKE